MFGELPKLFDRDFAIAYFLPSTGFVAATCFLIGRLQIHAPLFALSEESLLRDLAVFGLAALFWAIILSVLNRGVVRLMEGYWPFNLGQYFNGLERKRFRQLLEEEAQSDKERLKYSSDDFPRELQNKRNRIKQKKAERFPDREHLILPTSFGNTLRAFESYPRAVYGIDAIIGWPRLLAVVPEEYRRLIDAAKGQVDLWVNSSFLAVLATIEYFCIAVWARLVRGTWPRGRIGWFPFFTFVLAYIAYVLARNAATDWGQWVKSAFDLFLPELREKLGFSKPVTSEEERKMWNGFNKAALFKDAAAMPAKARTSPKRIPKDSAV